MFNLLLVLAVQTKENGFYGTISWCYFYFQFAEGKVSIIVRLFDPVYLTISAKFKFYAPNWPHTVFSLRHFWKN